MEQRDLITGYRRAISNPLIRFRTIVDLKDRRFMKQEIVVGLLKWGEYEPLPRLDYVLVFKNYFSGCEACVKDEYEKMFYQVSLVHHKNRRIIVHETKDLTEALSYARLLSERLNLSLKNASVREKPFWETRLASV
jgi:hypothetical protein